MKNTETSKDINNFSNPQRFILVRFFQGILIGAGGLLPGISGGNFALAFGVYSIIMSFIAHPFRSFWKDLKQLLPIGLGAVLGFLLAGKILVVFFERWQGEMIFLFAGCIVGTLPFLFKQTLETGKSKSCYVVTFVAFVLGLVLLLTPFFFNSFSINDSIFISQELENAVPQSTSLITWTFVGAVIGLGCLIPGTSASIILMYFGLYKDLLKALSSINVPVLACVGLGALVIILLLSKVIDFLFTKKKAVTNWAVLGFVFSSVFVIVSAYSECKTTFLPWVLFCVGALIAWLFEHCTKVNNAE